MPGALTVETLILREPASLLSLFHSMSAREAGRIVAVQGQKTLAVGDLARNARSIAAAVVRLNLGTHGVVGVYAYPGFELLSGLWGVLLAGAAYCPLSPDYPEERLRYMVAQSGMKVVVCEGSLVEALRDICGSPMDIVTLDDALQQDGNATRLRQPAEGDLAYVIFTSGSTGQPKGVMIEHGNIASQMSWFARSFLNDGPEVILQKTPFSFDAAQWELLAVAYGATLVFGEPQSYRSPVHIVDLVISHGVTVLQCVPTLWRALLETERLGECVSLRKLFSGGEVLPAGIVRECLAAVPHGRMVNLYGPTECTINATSFDCSAETARHQSNSTPIGFPVTHTELLVLDNGGRPVPQGRQGELYVGGAQVGRGYIGRPDLTAERFCYPLGPDGGRYYRTGDLVQANAGGALQFISRTDNQIKLRGYRIEVDEIRAAIENHDWVKTAGVFVRRNPTSHTEELLACVELSPTHAQLMDGNAAEDHHRSKSSKLQVKAQIARAALLTDVDLRDSLVIELPGTEPTAEQNAIAFGRKTYRRYRGDRPAAIGEIVALLRNRRPRVAEGSLDRLSVENLGSALRMLGEFRSSERLLPKYAYASPGALYPTQISLELRGVAGLDSGIYYYNPARHSLHLLAPLPAEGEPAMRIHFLGKNRAIEAVYKLNIREVVEIECGHALGVLDDVLAGHGLVVSSYRLDPDMVAFLRAQPDDHYIGSFSISDKVEEWWQGPKTTRYLQVNGDRVVGIQQGFYSVDGGMELVSSERVEPRHLIAINQAAMNQAPFCVALCVRTEDTASYIALGRALQHLQLNEMRYGFMSSGYSSRSGNDQRVVARLTSILGSRPGACYFCTGGRISDEQYHHRGMAEDAVHTKGPAELIREDLKAILPDFMLPNRIKIVPQVPTSANGKVDMTALRAIDIGIEFCPKDLVEPRTTLEADIAMHWRSVLPARPVSVTEDFFTAGGDSLGAVLLVTHLNEAFGLTLPLETLFHAPTIEKLAERMSANTGASSRMVRLRDGSGKPIFVWPGLGGYPASLRWFAQELCVGDRPVYALQASGLNAGEIPSDSISEMALADLHLILDRQDKGPFTFIGYSYGARIAFRTTQLIETSGDQVDNLLLMAPGNPIVEGVRRRAREPARSGFQDPAYTAVMLSVFTQTTKGPVVEKAMATIRDEAAFLEYVTAQLPDLDREVIGRATEVARRRYDRIHHLEAPCGHRTVAPTTVLKAVDDDESFLESNKDLTIRRPRFIKLAVDHYRFLSEPLVADVASKSLAAKGNPDSGGNFVFKDA